MPNSFRVNENVYVKEDGNVVVAVVEMVAKKLNIAVNAAPAPVLIQAVTVIKPYHLLLARRKLLVVVVTVDTMNVPKVETSTPAALAITVIVMR